MLRKSSGGVWQAGATMGRDYGTSATWYVDASRPNDSGAGTSVGTAKKTINAAIALAQAAGGGTIAIRSGTYREKVTIGGIVTYTTPLVLQPYGTDTVTISGANVLTGWTACTAGDATLLGSNWVNCYKTTIATASIESPIGPLDLNLYEAGVRMGLCHDSATDLDPISPMDLGRFHDADSFSVDGSSYITAVNDLSVIPNYTSAQLLNMEVGLYIFPNISRSTPITGVPDSDTITVTTTYTAEALKRYALLNALKNIKPGQWGVNKTPSGGNYTVYIRPSNPANLTSNIEVSVRNTCVATGKVTGSVTLRGLYIYQSSMFDNINTLNAVSSIEPRRGPLIIRDCTIGRNWTGLSTGAASMISLYQLDDVVIENCTLTDGGNSFAMSFAGCSDMTINKNRVEDTAYGFINYYGGASDIVSERIQVSYNYIKDAGRSPHSNLANFYLYCDNVLVYGNNFVNCGGYLTWQLASNIFVGFNELRRIVDQNSSFAGPDATDPMAYIWNNKLVPQSDGVNASMILGITGNLQEYGLYNNIMDGGGVVPSLSALRFEQKNNLFTQYGGGWTSGDLDATDIYDNVLGNTYIDSANGQFGYTAGGKAGKKGYDLRSTAIAAAKAAFPNFDFDRDMNGHPILWESAFIGPYNPRFRS